MFFYWGTLPTHSYNQLDPCKNFLHHTWHMARFSLNASYFVFIIKLLKPVTVSTINISLAWGFRINFKTTLISIAKSQTFVVGCWQKLSNKWDKTQTTGGWGKLRSVGGGSQWTRAKEKAAPNASLQFATEESVSPSCSLLNHKRARIFKNALNLQQIWVKIALTLSATHQNTCM